MFPIQMLISGSTLTHSPELATAELGRPHGADAQPGEQLAPGVGGFRSGVGGGVGSGRGGG